VGAPFYKMLKLSNPCFATN
ncbi:hypothetical protein AZ045_004354, partial [Enterobacter hormaechei]